MRDFVDRGDFYVKDKRLAPWDHRPLHSHPVATLTLIFAGRLCERFPSGEQSCPRWSVLFKPAGIPHTTASGAEGVRMILIGLLPGLTARCDRASIAAPWHIDAGVPAAMLLTLVERAWRGADVDILEAVAALFGAAAERRGFERRDATAPPWLRRARRMLAAPGPPPSRADVAARLRVHPASFTRAFSRCYGCTPSAYARRLRTDAAVERLLGVGTPPSAVAHELGYHDQSHLTRDLRGSAGVPPGRLQAFVRTLGA